MSWGRAGRTSCRKDVCSGLGDAEMGYWCPFGDGTTTEKVGTVQERWTGSGHRDGEVAAKVGSAGDRVTKLEIGTGQGSMQGQFRF